MKGLKRKDFIERSIKGALSFLKESIFADEYAAKAGFLQALDPRIKFLTFIFLLISILFSKSILVICCLYVFCLMLVLVSKVNIIFFLKRTWIFIPLFSLFIALPALFSVFTPGEALWSMNVCGHGLSVTKQGLSGATLFVMRVIASVSFAVLLSLTTRHFVLLKMLRTFGVPRIFVLTLGMSYRYIYLLLGVVESTFLAIKSRVGNDVHYKKGQHIVAWNMAALWHRSYYLSGDVYNAMLSRGYGGEPVLAATLRTSIKDWVWLGIVAMIFIFVIYLSGR